MKKKTLNYNFTFLEISTTLKHHILNDIIKPEKVVLFKVYIWVLPYIKLFSPHFYFTQTPFCYV